MTLPMIASISFVNSRTEVVGSLDLMEETRDWIDWRRDSFWSRRKVFCPLARQYYSYKSLMKMGIWGGTFKSSSSWWTCTPNPTLAFDSECPC